MYPNILQTDSKKPPDIRGAQPAPIGEGVIDQITFQAIDGDSLFDCINTAETSVGQAVLYRSLVRPLDSEDAIKAKQEAVREIDEKSNLMDKLESMVRKASSREASFYHLLYGTFVGFFGRANLDLEFEGYGYTPYRKAAMFMTELVHDAVYLADFQSGYLKECVETMRNFGSSRVHSLMKGPVYRTESGIRSKEEKTWYHPALIFRPTLFKPLFIAFLIGLYALWSYFNPVGVFHINPAAVSVLAVIFVPLIGLYVPIVGTFDRDECIMPLREIYRSSSDVQDTLEALGKIEELLVFVRYRRAVKRQMVLADLVTAKSHRMTLDAARNPILVKDEPAYVPNSMTLTGDELTLISGPNSGGKTAFCKTVAQIQLLTQVGCYVPAKSVETTVADRIFYQVPAASHLEHDGEGRFGTELRRTKEIFLASSHQSLVVFDELSEGTTYEEKLEISFDILEGFYRRGGSTILITHNHELIDRLVEKNMGQALQVEFEGRLPSFRLISGISRVSHADRVAERVGFSKRDIENYLKEKGYTDKSSLN